MKKLLFVAIFTLLSLPPLQAQAQTAMEEAMDVALERTFNDVERAIIEEYFSADTLPRYDDLPAGKKAGNPLPGALKKRSLPPGLEKQLRKNGKLPPGLEKRTIPSGLYEKIPACKKPGASCAIVGKSVLLLDSITETILDIIANAVK